MSVCLGYRGIVSRTRDLVGPQCGDLRPHTSAIRFIESDENRRQSIARLLLVCSEQLRTDPLNSQKVALRGEERQFIRNVDPAEIGAEFDAVKNLYRIAKADMLRPQIAVPVHNVASSRSLFENRRLQSQKLKLKAVNAFDDAPRQMMLDRE